MPDVSAESQSGGVHSRRVIFIDLARALAAVFMLYGHTVSALLAPRYQTGTWFDIWVFQRGLTSSLFLLLSGFAFSIATGRHWSSHAQVSPAVSAACAGSCCSSCSATRCTFRSGVSSICRLRRPNAGGHFSPWTCSS